MTSSISPSASFADMNDGKCRVTAEYNTRNIGPYPAQGGVWLCIQNKGTGTTVAVDLSDEDAVSLGNFLASRKT
jgi:hypothetical protein